MGKKVLVTGGAGFIGSHTVVELVEAGYEPVIVDNFQNSDPRVIENIKRIVNFRPTFYEIDIADKEALRKAFLENDIRVILHFAGLKSVEESVKDPLSYYRTNVQGSLNLIALADTFNVESFIFSSSATVYGHPDYVPIDETHRVCPINPYGKTKAIVEEMLEDWTLSGADCNVVCLRYFNPVGAHSSGLIGESPSGVPSNLIPFLLRVAAGEYPSARIFGADYDTKDGTGVRDYIHVVDLALGHIKAIQAKNGIPSFCTVNLGTGRGYSVLEVIESLTKISGKGIPYQIVERRQGDVASCFSSCQKAQQLLDWKATRGLTEMLIDSWNWQKKQGIIT